MKLTGKPDEIAIILKSLESGKLSDADKLFGNKKAPATLTRQPRAEKNHHLKYTTAERK